jgi:hypothetical protein
MIRLLYLIPYAIFGLVLCLLAKPFGIEDRVSWRIFGL